MISVILVQYGEFALTHAAIRSLLATQGDPLEVILVDNASPGFSPEMIQNEFPSVRVLLNTENAGFARASNRGAASATGDLLLFLNTDTKCMETFDFRVEQRFGGDATLGILGPRLENPDGSFQLSAGALPSIAREAVDKTLHALLRRGVPRLHGLVDRYFQKSRDVGWVTGAALFIRADLFSRLGGFDEKMFMYFEDKDLCKRARALGYRVLFDASFCIVHLKAGSSSASLSAPLAQAYRQSQRRYYEVHRPAWERSVLDLYQRVVAWGGSPAAQAEIEQHAEHQP